MKLEEEFFKIIEKDYPESIPDEDVNEETCQSNDLDACKAIAKKLIGFLTEQIDKEVTESNLLGQQTDRTSNKLIYAGKIVGLIEFKKKMEMI